MDYSLRELECFTAVAEELSFTRAAKRLHLAQPPLSRHIRTLEDKLGTRLFERQARGVKITAPGHVLLEETQGLLAQLTRAGEMARRAAHGESLRLRIGIVSAVLGVEIVETLRAFRDAYPSVQIMLHDLAPADQLQLIAEGKLDAGFVGLAPRETSSAVRYIRWRKEPVRVFVPSGHVACKLPKLRLNELKNEPFVAISSEAAPAFSTFVRELCRKAAFRPRIVMESPRAQAVAAMVAAGSGVAILPESLMKFTGDSAIGIPLKGGPEITHVLAVSMSEPSEAMQNLLRLLGTPTDQQSRLTNRSVRPANRRAAVRVGS